MIGRALAGFAVAAAIAIVARRSRSLTPGGAVAAILFGTCAAAAGWNWAALLIIYFASAAVLSHVGRAHKETRMAGIVAKGGERDAVQVFANGAMFCGAAVAMLLRPDVAWIALGAGSLAASAADTWATEIGTLTRGEPRSILTWRRLPVGTSGAVSLAGTLASLAGAGFTAAIVFGLGWTVRVAASIAVGGVAGSLADSLLGAAAQGRRWCDACNRETERAMHDCGAATRPGRGLAWMDNDVVNFLSAAAGGLLAAWLIRH